MWQDFFSETNKEKLKILLLLTIVYFVGFGTATSLYQPSFKSESQLQYSNIQSQTNENLYNAENCFIKGNVTDSKKIYYIYGTKYYNQVKPEVCFASEAEAIQAGFTINLPKTKQ